MENQKQFIDLNEVVRSSRSGEIEEDVANTIILKVLIAYLTKKIVPISLKNTYADAVPDIVSETLKTVWENLDSFDLDKASLTTWAATIARNKAYDFLRTQQREGKYLDVDQEIGDVEVRVEHMVESADMTDNRNAILSSIVKLDKDDMAIFFIRVYYHMSFSEIADVMQAGGYDLTVRGVENRFYRSRDKIKKVIRKNVDPQ